MCMNLSDYNIVPVQLLILARGTSATQNRNLNTIEFSNLPIPDLDYLVSSTSKLVLLDEINKEELCLFFNIFNCLFSCRKMKLSTPFFFFLIENLILITLTTSKTSHLDLWKV